jgi:hypothetical protein
LIPGEDIREGDEVTVHVYRDGLGWRWLRGIVTARRRGLTPIPEYAWTVAYIEQGIGKTGYFYARTIRRVET